MVLEPSDRLTDEEREVGLRRVILDGIANQSKITLTSGAFLVAFALALGADNKLIGLIAAIPPFLQLLQMPAIYLVERVRNRRLITVGAMAGNRVVWLGIAAIPFVAPQGWGLALLVAGLALQSVFAATSNCAWNSWMRDLVPQDRLGEFFSNRLTLILVAGIVVSLAAGTFVDLWAKRFPDRSIHAYSVLFGIAVVLGTIGAIVLARTPEPRMGSRIEGEPLRTTLMRPFQDRDWGKLLAFLGSWHFAVNLAAPFFTVYMLRQLELGLSTVIIMVVVSQVANAVFQRAWGRLADRYSNKAVLAASGPMFMLAVLLWTFTTLPDKHLLTIPLLVLIHVLLGMAMAGVNLAAGNIGLRLAPEGRSTAYLASGAVVTAIAAGTAPILGGLLADSFAARQLVMTLEWTGPGGVLSFATLSLEHWDFFFVFAFLAGLYALHRLSLVSEPSREDGQIVYAELFDEVRRDMQNLSPVGGLHRMVQFPYYLMREGTLWRR